MYTFFCIEFFLILFFRHLTKREQKLKLRRKQAEELLQWKERLDAEERCIRALEQEALSFYERKHQIEKLSESKGEFFFFLFL